MMYRVTGPAAPSRRSCARAAPRPNAPPAEPRAGVSTCTGHATAKTNFQATRRVRDPGSAARRRRAEKDSFQFQHSFLGGGAAWRGEAPSPPPAASMRRAKDDQRDLHLCDGRLMSGALPVRRRALSRARCTSSCDPS